ncbi:hypothetical protein [Marinobacter similis]|uniref:hypothetical protein n=1 Tax=Marinobacter similis TaxID=1420916 RepID=UPI001F232A6E|nr:hypothetical protein [Marinobacter similis]
MVISRERTDLSIDPDAEFQFFSTEYIKAPFAERVGSATYREIEPVLDLALNNGHTFYILERLRYFNGGQKTDPFRNCFNYLPHLQEMVLRATDLVLASEADYLVFSSTPHDIEAWLTFLVAASQGKKVYAVGQSELPWRAYVKEIRPDASLGCRTVDYFPQRTGDRPSASHAPSEDVRRYIARKQKDYVDAEPDYMKNQKSGKTRKDRGARLKKSLRRAFEGREPKNRDSISNVDREISKLLTNFRSRRLRAALSRFAVSRSRSRRLSRCSFTFSRNGRRFLKGGDTRRRSTLSKHCVTHCPRPLSLW